MLAFLDKDFNKDSSRLKIGDKIKKLNKVKRTTKSKILLSTRKI